MCNTRTDTSQFARFDSEGRAGCDPGAASRRDGHASDETGRGRGWLPGTVGCEDAAGVVRPPCPVRPALVLVLAVVSAGPAWAGDGESAASAGVGLATYATPAEDDEAMLMPTGGLSLQATYERGLGDYASVRGHLAGAIYGGGGIAGTGLGTLGLSYRLDVLRYVPYAFVAAGVLVRGGGPFETGVEPALEIGGGVDVLRGRDRSWGVVAAVTSFASDTTTVSVAARTTWRWGYF